jgi:uncharacterized membrane protein SpoIIM required for sporulation
MVLESFLKPESIESKPWEMFFYSIVITSVSLWLSIQVFPSASSLVFVFLITLASFPLFYRILSDDELVDEKEIIQQISFYQRHKRTINIFGYFFLGVMVTTSFWASLISAENFESVFGYQMDSISDIRGDWSPSGNAIKPAGIFEVLFNNIRVTTLAFLLSFFFGTGAIFVLAWNASVLGVFATGIAKGHESVLVGHLNAFLSISIHAIPEIFAYFLAGIAGGILSFGIMRGKHDKVVIEDAFATFAASVFVLVFAALLETFVTPIL